MADPGAARPAAPDARRRVITVLHTSDVHVGHPGADDGGMAGLRAVVDAAARQGVDLLLVAGDLFDHNRLPERVVDAAGAELARLPCPALILPGNHDPLERDSVYRRLRLPDTIRILRAPQGETVRLPQLDLSVWGRPHTSYEEDFRPLEGLPPRGDAAWELAVAHGHWVAAPSYRAYLITPGEIAASGRDFIALGHWDGVRDVSAGGVPAWYSGSPSRLNSSLLLTLNGHPHGPRVHARRLRLAGPP